MKINELVAFRDLRKERARHEIQNYTLTEDNRKGTGAGANGSIRIRKHGATVAYYVSAQSCQCKDYKHRIKPELPNHPDLKCKHQEMLADLTNTEGDHNV